MNTLTELSVPTREVTFTIKVELPVKGYERELRALLADLDSLLADAPDDDARAEVYERFFGDVTMHSAATLEERLVAEDLRALDEAATALHKVLGSDIKTSLGDCWQAYLPLDQYLQDDLQTLHPFPEH